MCQCPTLPDVLHCGSHRPSGVQIHSPRTRSGDWAWPALPGLWVVSSVPQAPRRTLPHKLGQIFGFPGTPAKDTLQVSLTHPILQNSLGSSSCSLTSSPHAAVPSVCSWERLRHKKRVTKEMLKTRGRGRLHYTPTSPELPLKAPECPIQCQKNFLLSPNSQSQRS